MEGVEEGGRREGGGGREEGGRRRVRVGDGVERPHITANVREAQEKAE